MLFTGTFVWSSSVSSKLSIAENHLLAVNDDGFITHFQDIGTSDSVLLLENTVEKVIAIPRGSFLLPTFCDLHLHAPQFLYQGNGLHLPLMQWLDEYAFKAEERMDADPFLARRVYERLARRLIDIGTGAVLLFGTIKEDTNIILADVMQMAGIRAFIAKSFVNRCRNAVAHLSIHRQLTEPVLTPRFVPTCSDELLRGLGQLSETMIKLQWVRNERGIEDIEVFQKAGLLTPRTIQAHCTFLDVASLSQVQQAGTAIAHCPLSNAYFSSEPFRLREALQQGVKVGLGTDIAGGYSLDLMNAMRQSVVISRMRQGDSLGIDWKESISLATRGGAEALGLSVGKFEIGCPFDAQCIELFDPETGIGSGALDFFDLELLPQDDRPSKWLTEDMVEKWWCLGDERNRNGMWVQGHELKRSIIRQNTAGSETTYQ
ncbi:hypothetical protein C8J56DRAFT_999896 [Mycena floridula]|nr:hypothetical protein C8J56DRAFT_999896 [Mycena floridula]